MNARVETLVRTFGTVHAYGGEDEGLFLVSPNRIGFGVMISPLQTNDELTAQKLAMLPTLGFPANSMLQFCAFTSPDYRAVLDAYARDRLGANNPVLQQMSRDRIAFLTESATRPLDEASGMLLHDTQVIVCATIPFKGSAPTDADLRRARELATSFYQTLKAARFGPERLDAARYIRWMEAMLNTSPEALWKQTSYPRYDNRRLICEQLLDPGNVIDYDEQGVWLSRRTRARVLTPKFYPAELDFGMAMQYLCDWTSGSRGIRENALITLNVLIPDQDKLTSHLDKKYLWATQQASTPMAKWDPAIRDTKAAFDQIMALKAEGEVLVKAYLSFAVFNHAEDDSKGARERAEQASIAATANARAYWSEMGFKMAQETCALPVMFPQLLPFAGDSEIAEFQQRYRTMGSRHMAAMAPVLGSWRGTGTPMLTLVSRDGQLQPISNWDAVAPHGLIIASTGSGKSFLAQELLCNAAATGVQCFVIDFGYSYKNITELLDGTFLSFGDGSEACLNPFTLVRDFKDEAEILLGIIATMAAPLRGLDEFQRPGVSRVMQEVFHQLGNEMTVRDLAEALKREDDPRLTDVGKQLYPFAEGEHARYFNGRNNINPDSPFVTLELEDLRSRKGLSKVVLMSLIYQIQQVVYGSPRDKRKMLLIDEAYALLCEEASDGHNESIATFLENSYRRFRKHSASCFIISQNMEDVWRSAAGRAIVGNSHNQYLLAQSSATIDSVEREKRLPFGKWGYDLLKSVHTVPGSYSEIMVVTENHGVGVGRLVVSPFTQLLYSTTGAEVQQLRNLRARGMSLVDAINTLLAQRQGQRRAA
jgi:conjugal transfer ATP-binding protein TraC